MDKKALIKTLNKIFCDKNKIDKRYLEVWLSDVDFGGLYKSDRYVLNVKAEHVIDSCTDEIKNIIQMLDREAKEELKYIWRVDVYYNDKEIHCSSDDILIYTEQEACS
ncbi:MAG: hypothetical protein ACR2FN_05480 [Chitinophagaceae bacterium]